MRAKDFKFEVNQEVRINHEGWHEIGYISAIPDGPFVDEIEIGFGDGSFGFYSPYQIGELSA